MNASLPKTAPMHPEDWSPILELAVQEVFEIMVGSRLDPAMPSESIPPSEFTAMVGLTGSLNAILTVSCGSKVACQIAARMLGAEIKDSECQICDALGEISNMIAGNFKNKLTGLDGRCFLSIPSVVIGAEFRLHSMAVGHSLKTVLGLEGAPVIVRLDFHG